MTDHQHQPRQGRHESEMHGHRTERRQMSGQEGHWTGDQQSGGRQGGHRMEGQQTGGRRMGSPQIADQMGGGGTSGQQTGGQQLTEQMGEQQPGTQSRSFEDHMTDELRIVLEDFSELSHVAAWCATECASGPPELGTCVRVCQDIAEIAELNEMLIARDSMFGPEVADMFIRVADEGVPELQRHRQRHPHVAETIATIERTMDSCETVLQQVGRGSRMGGQMAGQLTSGGGQRDRMTGGQQPGQSTGGQGMQGMRERGQHGRGMSSEPTGRPEPTGRQY